MGAGGALVPQGEISMKKFLGVAVVATLAIVSVGGTAHSASFAGNPNMTPLPGYTTVQKKKCTLAQCQKNYCDRVHPGSATCAAKCVDLGNC
jgi:hypothetical protein